MVNYCVCARCTNSSLTGHRVHHFPGRKSTSFRAWVRFVQVKRADFTAASVTTHSVICGAHFTPECYQPGDLMEYKMGFRCLDRVRLVSDAVPSVHSSRSPLLELPPDSGAGGTDDVQQLLESKEEVPPEQQDQEDPAEPPHIKEEQEEVWTKQEGEQLQGLEEPDVIKFTFTSVAVKSEDDDDDEEKPQVTDQTRTEADGEDCGGPEPAQGSDPGGLLQAGTGGKTSRCSEPETDDSCDWEQTSEPSSGSHPVQNHEVSDEEGTAGKTSRHSECASRFDHEGHRPKQNGNQTGQKPFSCTVCGKRYRRKDTLTTHMRLHSEGKRFSCSVCKKMYQFRGEVVMHMRVHTGEKPFSCSVCGAGFRRQGHLREHERIHMRDKPFSCSYCGKGFAQSSALTSHLRVHSGERPFTCLVCNASFIRRSNLSTHMRMHTGEKPVSCGRVHVIHDNL